MARVGAQRRAVSGLGDIVLSNRHAGGSGDSGLSPVEAKIAVALGLSPEAMTKQQITDANINEQGRLDGEQAIRRLAR